MASVRPRVIEFDVTVDQDRTATSGDGGSRIPHDEAWRAEHLVLAGAVRCVLTSLDYHARRLGLRVTAAGSAHGVVTKRETDGKYAFVEIEERLEVELDRPLDVQALRELVARAENGCFVGNSLTARPRYRWVVDGTEVA